MLYQKTIKQPCHISGIGLHSGQKVSMTLLPAPENTGITFIRTDQKMAQIPVNINSIHSTKRATILQKNNCQIITPEHFLAVLSVLGIDNLRIEINAPELPIKDGSSKAFLEIIQKNGIQKLKAEKKVLKIQTPYLIQENNISLMVLPEETYKITFIIEYPDSFIGTQIHSFEINESVFSKEIAAARTYGFYQEIETLKQKGLIKGGSLDNALVIKDNGYLNKLRYPDELVRHKILDLIGDLSLLATPVIGHFIGIKSGHALNMQMVKKLNDLA
ncbi:UDP-3-O-[3-hydroxymyristoyl] N-acetylglucosamine deacetylase [bacterium]|jgi:UDP-3-O-acyl N-acetylglucosamine deacetylase|nr:UDP-3-O-[3-hydroxymyristoyl] N-acetylglucosamine deacetylase [bacterium]MBT3580959.1 UDP-3-O-[3-hydroxymyristoyl] N-acetylglucosamine deacetylase [bacterium]MBT4551965.1 UDP-3-O-[3-hydroxymyristoyl] N-acetylglucosamine deacetylase [bacterium]MBT7087416.1 UDP-3-O-[3-hydroxymyristoyl] N-acetylglucosamine deacetylase [bacterium]